MKTTLVTAALAAAGLMVMPAATWAAAGLAADLKVLKDPARVPALHPAGAIPSDLL